ncbi:hypothetical protein N7456_001281 [Penicillium angulare]|uniref:Zn(2)-C6 fungal-type domain-containing protein n=1 Tax=Penicillium angulare TaxID=116970 RepID=A0A9W9GF38_9EURO|nr:hypothetical protein N7456_001281 [Penicillium angulare]
MKDNNAQAANTQAWRRNPRNFAPKSRLGCKTCKIRRVKCDLARPSCSRCLSTGRTCDGYPEKLDTVPSKRLYKTIAPRADKCNSSYRFTTISADGSELRCSQHYESISPNLGAFMILPMAGSAHTEAMCFFNDVSIKHLNEYRPCQLWRKTLMIFAQTVPAVRHAAIALAMIHRTYLDHSTGEFTPDLCFSKYQPLDKAPLHHYNRAIQLLLELDGGKSAEITAVTLLVCYLFTCFDHLVGDDAQAFKHLRGGLALSRNIDSATFNNNTDKYEQSSGFHAIICQATHQIRRLDMQAGMFLVDWSPTDIQDTFMTALAPCDSTFQSLDQAADHLQILLTQVMKLRSTEQQLAPTGTIPPLPPSLADATLNNLNSWSSHFESFLDRYTPPELTFGINSLVSLLRLQHTVAYIILCGGGTSQEMSYDNFMPQFKQCIAFATEVAAAHEKYSGSTRLTFTPEIGFIPVLYIIGAKCRDPNLRREALSLLRRQIIREASWDSISTAKVLERIIEIEEDGTGEHQIVKCMQHVPAWRRIEALSFSKVRRAESADGLDITYTFCGQVVIYNESLVI